jgi:putative alpha-1,2-mannosidase
MSAWYLMSSLGFYTVNPASNQYVVGSPFFDKVTIDFPGSARPLTILAPGAPSKLYVRSLSVNGETVREPVIKHEQIVGGGQIVFEMSDVPEAWGS